jgi:hypothetical protein
MTEQRPPDEGQTATLEDRVEAALDALEQLVDTTLPALVHRVEALETLQPGGAEKGLRRSEFRFDHPLMAGKPVSAERAAKAWDQLHQWVRWLVGEYRLTTLIPPCWPQHPVLREEMAALYLAWDGAWKSSAASDAPAAFLDRLDRARGRWGDSNWGVPRCGGNHDPTGRDMPDLYRDWDSDARQRSALIAALHRIQARLRQQGGDR